MTDIGSVNRASRWPPESDGIDLIQLANIARRRWKLLVGLPLIAALAGAVVSLLLPNKFTATATFIPEQGSQRAQLGGGAANLLGLAAQFGLAAPGGATSPQFYVSLLQSRNIRDLLLRTKFPVPGDVTPHDSVPLVKILRVRGKSDLELLELGRKRLEAITTVDADRETGLVTVSVQTRYPTLSAAIANQYVALVNRFNLNARRFGAREQRKFVEDRLAAMQTELQNAEDHLRTFLERNRQYETSPSLLFEYQRLERQVTMKQEVVTALRRQYEEARIQEVNDTPLLTVVDSAVVPARRSSPRRRAVALFGLLIGAAAAAAIALGEDLAARRPRGHLSVKRTE